MVQMELEWKYKILFKIEVSMRVTNMHYQVTTRNIYYYCRSYRISRCRDACSIGLKLYGEKLKHWVNTSVHNLKLIQLEPSIVLLVAGYLWLWFG